jgi:hypothetical protein
MLGALASTRFLFWAPTKLLNFGDRACRTAEDTKRSALDLKQLIVLGPQEPLALSQAESRAVARALHEKDDLVRRSLNVARFLVKVKAAY